jgi:hypothetical protein
MPGLQDFSVYTGEDFDQTLTWTDNSGNPVNLTGYSASMTMSTTGIAPVITLGGTLGTIRIQIAHSVISAASPFSVSYRLFLVNTVPETECLFAGTFRTLLCL